MLSLILVLITLYEKLSCVKNIYRRKSPNMYFLKKITVTKNNWLKIELRRDGQENFRSKKVLKIIDQTY